MIIVGIDPGSIRVGYSVIRVESTARKPQVLDLGVWELTRPEATSALQPKMPLGMRLEKLAENLSELIRKWNPRYIGLEKAVHFRNAASSHVLSESRGVIRLVLHQELESAHDRLFELSPTFIKKIASGFGAASKEGVLKSLEFRFPELREIQEKNDFHFDAFDALAIALSAWTQVKKSRVLRAQARQAEI
jgi:crossover junction endodeoxyribonuclease RuvC